MAFMDIFNFLSTNQPSIALNIVASLVVFLLTIIIGRLLGRLLHKVLNDLELDSILAHKLELGIPAEKWAGSILSSLIYVAGIVWAIRIIGIPLSFFQWVLMGVIILILGLVIISLKDIFLDFFGFLVLRRKNSLEIGDQVRIGELKGIVVRVGFRETQISSRGDQRIFVPNRLLVKAIAV